MDKAEQHQLRQQIHDAQEWSLQAAAVQRWHGQVAGNAAAAERAILDRSTTVSRGGYPAWRVIPLSESDNTAAQQISGRAELPPMTAPDQQLLALLTDGLPRAAADARVLLGGLRRVFSRAGRREAGQSAAQFLREQHASLIRADIVGRLQRLGQPLGSIDPARAHLGWLLAPGLGFQPTSSRPADLPAAELIPAQRFAGLSGALATIDEAVHGELRYRAAAEQAGTAVRRTSVETTLLQMPLERLRDASKERLPMTPLERAGLSSVLDVLTNEARLKYLPGVGEVSARRASGAARALERTLLDETPVQIDVHKRPPEATELLRRLAQWDACRRTRGAPDDLERAAELQALPTVMHQATQLLVLPLRTLSAGSVLDGLDAVLRRAQLLAETTASSRSTSADPWTDFLARPADYFAMLSELGFITEDEDKTYGDLPDEIIAAVRDQPLNGDHLTASLRGYQSFAARFALVQRKVIIGDEMGLGKTVEAIAVMAHLRSRGATHFLVICPAAVLTNWTREVAAKSKLTAHRVHGLDRERAAKLWQRSGGIAVTTYETLAWWESGLDQVQDLACVIVDEAHYVKNPAARRSVRTQAVLTRCERAVLLTGTPMENRVEEFRNLVGYLRPDLARRADSFSATTFRTQVAPAYLRRNQEDVLTELPELIETQEWLPMSAADASTYESAVLDGNFMAMRQSAMINGEKSLKMARLVEIVLEAEENGRRVIVFSNFVSVLAEVAAALPGKIYGPISGSVAPAQRQVIVDQFSAAQAGAALMAQIQAGGVGLNIQSASVVVICEPQLKPTIEAQAVARAHRMGQVQTVQVHRLLSEDSVDERIMGILAEKQRLFDEFARVSSMAEATPEAFDLSEAELVRQVIAEERQRLAERRSSAERQTDNPG